MDLERFLKTLSQEGERDSSGGFTLDPGRAREKLKQYQQPFPYAFVGSLLASAHLAGAEAVTIKVSARGMILAWPSPTLTPEQIRDIFSGLFVAGLPPFVRELALGLNGVLSMQPRRLELLSGRWRHQLAPLEMVREHASTPGVRIEIEYHWTSWPARQLLGRLPEIDILKERCMLSVAALRLNDQPLTIPTPDGRCLASTLLQGGPPLLSAPLRKALPPADFHYDLQGKGPHGGIFGLYLDEPSDFRLVVDGLSFPHELSIPGAWGYLVAPQLRRDLSAFTLVRDEHYDHLVTVIHKAFQFLLHSYAQTYSQLERKKQRDTSSVLLYLGNEEAAQGRRQKAEVYYRQVVEAYRLVSPLDWNYFRAAYCSYVIQLTTPDSESIKIRELAQDFQNKAFNHLGVTVQIKKGGSLRVDNVFSAHSRQLQQEIYDLNHLLLGRGYLTI